MNSFSLFNVGEVSLEVKKDFPALSEKYEKMIETLDEFQLQAVESDAKNFLQCIASAGSGKTRTIVSRAIKLVHIDKVDPTKIVLITFTNKAAREIKERYLSFFGEDLREDLFFSTPHISTIHSFSLHQLRRVLGLNRTILSGYHSLKLFKEVARNVFKEIKLPAPEIKLLNHLFMVQQRMVGNLDILFVGVPIFNSCGDFEKMVSWEEMQALFSPCYIKNLPWKVFSQSFIPDQFGSDKKAEILENYTKMLNIPGKALEKVLNAFFFEKYSNQTLDFGDMSYQLLLLLSQQESLRKQVQSRISHIIMDEAQDTDPVQFLTCIFSDLDSFSTLSRKW